MLCVCEVSFIHRHSNYYLMDKMGSMNKLKKRVSLGSSILIIATNFAQTIIFRFSLILIFKLRIQKIYPSLTHTLSLSLYLSLSLSLSLSLYHFFSRNMALLFIYILNRTKSCGLNAPTTAKESQGATTRVRTLKSFL